jgi:hypothetical protein
LDRGKQCGWIHHVRRGAPAAAIAAALITHVVIITRTAVYATLSGSNHASTTIMRLVFWLSHVRITAITITIRIQPLGDPGLRWDHNCAHDAVLHFAQIQLLSPFRSSLNTYRPHELRRLFQPCCAAPTHPVAIVLLSSDSLCECSNAGLCDRTSGRCRCFVGYEGEACQRCSLQGEARAL